MHDEEELIPEELGGFRIVRKLGAGSFGEIYLGEHIDTNKKVAIKIEPINDSRSQLLHEYKVYRVLKSDVGFPAVLYYGTHDGYNCLVMDRLGPSLEKLLNLCGRQLSLKTVLMLVEQALHRIEHVHSRFLIHRDINFGLAKRYRSSKTGRHIPYKENKNLTGTARYASIGAHLGYEQSRRDDLESLGYVFVYLLLGRLPWQGLSGKTRKEKYANIATKKRNTPVETLCKDIPDEFALYLNYCRSLRFTDKPDYNFLRRLFRKLFKRKNLRFDYSYDWSTLSPNTGSPDGEMKLDDDTIEIDGENLHINENLDEKDDSEAVEHLEDSSSQKTSGSDEELIVGNEGARHMSD